MKKSGVVCSVVFGLLLAFGAGCDTARQALQMQKPTVALKGLSFGEITLESATLLFDVEVGNPYSVALPLTNLDYALTSGARPLFSGKAEAAQTIAAKNKAVVRLPAKISYLDLVRAFKDVRPGSAIPYNADMKLSMDAPLLGAIGVPLAKEGQLNVPEIPNLETFDWKSKVLNLLGTD
ncbi:MAG: LEA type 2 family protein [Phycisphaerae bacterium]|nr:LEA type 2 family protein [Phycisphaerae bacterium]